MTLSTTRRLLLAATLVATVATAGSLYFSNVLGLAPCRLCWFQRIFMYPLVPILGIAVWENRAEVYRTALPLASLGWGIAAFHSYLQIAGQGTLCTSFCSTIQFTVFGILTIPNLSLIAFTMVIGLLWTVRARTRD